MPQRAARASKNLSRRGFLALGGLREGGEHVVVEGRQSRQCRPAAAQQGGRRCGRRAQERGQRQANVPEVHRPVCIGFSTSLVRCAR